MNHKILLMFESPWQWLVILAVILLLFGSSKLPQLAKSLGQSKRAFREGLDEAEEEARLEKVKREKAQQLEADTSKSALSDVDDEQLFEEARRRASRLRAAETNEQGKR